MDENEAMDLPVGQEERNEEIGENTQASTQQATQPVVKEFITDIFGEDSDDEDRAAVASKPSASNVNDDDGLFDDSDDDAAPNQQKTSRLKKGGLQQKSSSSSSKSKQVDDLFGDDDDDDEEDTSRAKEAAHQRSQANAKKNKRSSSDRRVRDEKKLKKRRFDETSASARGSGDGTTEAAHESGDEYDSGEDIQKTAEDENFIDENDDLDDIRGEYDAEDQNFDDERPEDYRPKKSKHQSSKKGGDGSSSSGGAKADDPFSKTLAAMKKPKAKEMTELEKDRLSENLLRQMSAAQLNDEECFERGNLQTTTNNTFESIKLHLLTLYCFSFFSKFIHLPKKLFHSTYPFVYSATHTLFTHTNR